MPSSIIIFKGEVPVGAVPTIQDLPGVMDIEVQQATRLNNPDTVNICSINAKDEEVLAHAGMIMISNMQRGVEYAVYNIQDKKKEVQQTSKGA